MSLEELLSNTESSSIWKTQRRRLLRVVGGLLISTVALVAGVGFLLSNHSTRAPASIASTVQEDEDAKSLTRLMQIQKRAETLKREVDDARENTASFVRPRGRAVATKQIVNYQPGEGFTALIKDKAEIYLPTGAVFQAQLLTPIKTSVERSFVMAETTSEFRMDMNRRILKGSRLIGTSRLNPVLKGVIVEFNTLVSPKGIESPISGLALSRNALPELEGLYYSDRLLTYGTALAFGFLSGFADASREREFTALGSVPVVSPSNQVITGFSTAAFQVANDMLRDIRSSAVEYVVVPAGDQVFVVLTRRYDINQGGTK